GPADRRQAFGVPGEAAPGLDELRGQVRYAGERVLAPVVADALRRAGEERQVVRLAGVRLAVRVAEVGALLGQPADVRRLRVTDHTVVPLVLQDHDHHMVGP